MPIAAHIEDRRITLQFANGSQGCNGVFRWAFEWVEDDKLGRDDAAPDPEDQESSYRCIRLTVQG
jgi:hypothetical protein